MNTTELVERVAAEHGATVFLVAPPTSLRPDLPASMPPRTGAITAAASAGDDVVLAGFGRFKVSDRAARQGRNPATGETITIAASKKRIKGLCGVKPPQKPRWTNAGFGRRLALWKFYAGRPLAGLIIVAQAGGGE
jgi:DNA-binding protein HU-beta